MGVYLTKLTAGQAETIAKVVGVYASGHTRNGRTPSRKGGPSQHADGDR